MHHLSSTLNKTVIRRLLRGVFALICALIGYFGGVASTTAEAKQQRVITHVVQKKQNLGMIAKRYHTTPAAIRKANGLRRQQKLKVGQKLRVIEVEEHRKWRKYLEKKRGKKAKKKKRGKKAKKKKRGKKAKKKKRGKKAKKKKRGKKAKKKKKKASKRKRRKKKASKKKRRTRRPAPKGEYAKRPRRRGYVNVERHTERFRGQLVNSRGRLLPRATKRMDRLLRSLRSKKSRKINRRLLKLLAMMSDHFGGRKILAVSGYRPYSAKQYTRNSRHNHAAAIDFRIIGVPNRVVYNYCRRFRRVGCGYYPNSLFIHMDVRKHKTHWVDYSRPGQPPRYARRARRHATAAGGTPKKTLPKKTLPKKTLPKKTLPKKTGLSPLRWPPQRRVRLPNRLRVELASAVSLTSRWSQGPRRDAGTGHALRIDDLQDPRAHQSLDDLELGFVR
jgi:uncharacterized protein YcbK (DUF882 family)